MPSYEELVKKDPHIEARIRLALHVTKSAMDKRLADPNPLTEFSVDACLSMLVDLLAPLEVPDSMTPERLAECRKLARSKKLEPKDPAEQEPKHYCGRVALYGDRYYPIEDIPNGNVT